MDVDSFSSASPILTNGEISTFHNFLDGLDGAPSPANGFPKPQQQQQLQHQHQQYQQSKDSSMSMKYSSASSASSSAIPLNPLSMPRPQQQPIKPDSTNAQNWDMTSFRSQPSYQVMAAPSGSSSSRQRSQYNPPLPSQSRSRTGRTKSPPSAVTPHAAPSAPMQLLTLAEKKANHIASEQKRRANIKKGYDALCFAVPSLREAVQAEENLKNKGAAAAAARGRKGKKDKGNDGEKVDGRAGAKSENVVLQKTVDHIRSLIIQRQQLLEDLNHQRGLARDKFPVSLHESYGLFQSDLGWESETHSWIDGDHDDGSDED